MKKIILTTIVSLFLITLVLAGGVIIGGGGLGIKPIFTTPTQIKQNLLDKGIDGFTVSELDCNDVNYRCYEFYINKNRKINFMVMKYDISKDPKVEYTEEENQVLVDEKVNRILENLGRTVETSQASENKISETNYKI